MQIELTISTHCLGDDNTNTQNNRYANKVKRAIKSEYPEADVSVELVSNVTAGDCWISDDPTGEIAENVNMISNQVWDKADY